MTAERAVARDPESYEPARTETVKGRQRVLISGNGDSAVIELAQYMIKDFSHKNVLSFLPSEELALELGNLFGKGVFNLLHRQVEGGSPDFSGVAGPVSWYWWQRNRIANSADPKEEAKFGKDREDRVTAKIFRAIDRRLARYSIGETIPLEVGEEIEREIDEPLMNFASYELRNLVHSFKFKNIFGADVAERFRDSAPVVIGKTPTIYSARQSPMNWFLLGALEHFGRFKYVNARLVSAKRARRSIKVTLDVGGKPRTMDFDKVVVRHGPDYENLRHQPVGPKVPAGYFRLDYGRWIVGTHGTPVPDWENPFVSYFQTDRWRSIASAPSSLEATATPRPGQYAPEQSFLALCTWGYAEQAEPVFRQLKAAATDAERARYAAMLDSMRFSGSLGQLERASHETHP